MINSVINYFDLFEMPRTFQVDAAELESRYKQLQAAWHPDRFTGADDSKRLQALQKTSLVNDAYVTLKSPLKRAAHLLALQGVDAEEHNQAHFGADFLYRQMILREQLEALGEQEDMAGLDAMKAEVSSETNAVLEEFEALYGQGQFSEAKQRYNRLQFLFKLLDEIDAVEENLLDY